MSAYDTYTFNFKDTLSKGLTYGDITSVTVEGRAMLTLVKDTRLHRHHHSCGRWQYSSYCRHD